MSLIEAISIVTGISKEYILEIEFNSKMDQQINNYLNKNNITISNFVNKFNYKELKDKGWLNFTHIDDKISVLLDILKYLRVSSIENLYNLDSDILYKSRNGKPELLILWLERCYKLSLEQSVKKYDSKNVQVLVNYIRDNAKNNVFDENELIKVFNNNGVKLVIEDDLSTSKIRGAFKVNRSTPSIYLTRKHHRIADIYFALLHELSHCKTDYNKAKGTNIITHCDEDVIDSQALNWMVDNDYYNEVVLRNDYDIEKESKYPKCFIVYRLALDNRIKYSNEIYQKYNILLGYSK